MQQEAQAAQNREARNVTNIHGRPWEEFDAIRAQALIGGPFVLVSERGEPLCGRHVHGEEPVTYTAAGWK